MRWGPGGGGELVKGTISPLIQIPVIKTIFGQLGLTSKLPLRRYKHWQTMHIIKVEYVLINVCFHLLVVSVTIRRFLVVSLESRRDSQSPSEKQLRSTARPQRRSPQPWGAKKDGGQSMFSSPHCPGAGWVQWRRGQAPCFAIKKR